MRGMAYRVYRPVSWPLELRSFSRPFRDYSTWGADPGAQAPGYSRKSLRDRTASHWRATVPAGRLGEFGANHREKIRAARQRSPTGRIANWPHERDTGSTIGTAVMFHLKRQYPQAAGLIFLFSEAHFWKIEDEDGSTNARILCLKSPHRQKSSPRRTPNRKCWRPTSSWPNNLRKNGPPSLLPRAGSKKSRPRKPS